MTSTQRELARLRVSAGITLTSLLTTAGVTALLLQRAFRAADVADPNEKARRLTDGISFAMNAAMIGGTVFWAAAIAIVVFSVRLRRAKQRPPEA